MLTTVQFSWINVKYSYKVQEKSSLQEPALTLQCDEVSVSKVLNGGNKSGEGGQTGQVLV